ncbi:MAG: ribosome silencing factor [Neomegalonema sp.]|nr:ribosome silencing factor [Neomegalonema sp.]
MVQDDDLLTLVLESLDDDKAEDVVTIDLRGKSSLGDYMVIASGRSSRHVSSICDKLLEKLKTKTGYTPRAEGLDQGDWALIDARDVIIHVFRPEVREFYDLEKMWVPIAEGRIQGDGSEGSGSAA